MRLLAIAVLGKGIAGAEHPGFAGEGYVSFESMPRLS